jgi:hypothetical protein
MLAIIVLAGVGFLAISAAVTLAVIIIGIHRGDRRNLTITPQSNSDAFARRLLVGVRHPSRNADGEDK